ncbi:hypothetical protein LC55x_0121 [Lysobacter capsici]|nr:hypothetical protein LC55x_0121 [Lysobacter capsici]
MPNPESPLPNPGSSWHGSCVATHAPCGAGARRRLELEQGLAKRSRGKPGGRMSGDIRPLFIAWRLGGP